MDAPLLEYLLVDCGFVNAVGWVNIIVMDYLICVN